MINDKLWCFFKVMCYVVFACWQKFQSNESIQRLFHKNSVCMPAPISREPSAAQQSWRAASSYSSPKGWEQILTVVNTFARYPLFNTILSLSVTPFSIFNFSVAMWRFHYYSGCLPRNLLDCVEQPLNSALWHFLWHHWRWCDRKGN